MCGIAGIISSNPSLINSNTLQAMAASLSHRGPDGQAVWINAQKTAGFAHRRLCVIDTSNAAAQPMHLRQRYTIIYNGEIYNYRELKVDLIKKGHAFRTHSDTEVILASYSEYGGDCVDRFDGMFAFALWDDVNQVLFCARDRFGEKPFFYRYDEGSETLYFASEMKALHAAGLAKTPNHTLMLAYLTIGYTSDPEQPEVTFDQHIKKLPAAHTLMFSPASGALSIRRYWKISPGVSSISLNDAVTRFGELLTESITRRLRSDVPLGTSLSGGLDSSTILTIINGVDKGRLNTFTAAFPGFERDESEKAKAIAESFGCINLQVAPDAAGFAEDFQKLLYFQEEPFTSASIYAQFKVFELAAEHGVTVLLDGQGADETLAGYDKYLNWKARTVFPELTSGLLRRKAARSLMNDPYIHPEFVAAHAKQISIRKPVVRSLNDMLYYDTFCRGLEELLRYADRNSMAHGREVRLPFLYHELVAFVFSLPSTYKIGHGYTKYVLRNLMKDKLPHSIGWNKRKTGFEPPQEEWMKHPLVLDLRQESLRALVESKMLKKEVMIVKPRQHGAYHKNSYEWRWLVAGSMMLLNKKGV